jgi:hypothetical protein
MRCGKDGTVNLTLLLYSFRYLGLERATHFQELRPAGTAGKGGKWLSLSYGDGAVAEAAGAKTATGSFVSLPGRIKFMSARMGLGDQAQTSQASACLRTAPQDLIPHLSRGPSTAGGSSAFDQLPCCVPLSLNV